MRAQPAAKRQPPKPKKKPSEKVTPQPEGAASGAQDKLRKRSRAEQTKEKRFKRPAEVSAGLAGGVSVLVSLIGFKGSQAKELTASLVGVVGVLPWMVSKFTDWKRGKDEREVEQLDLMEERNILEERAAIALESLASRGALPQEIKDAADVITGDTDEAQEDE